MKKQRGDGVDKTPQKMRWTTVFSSTDFTEARAKADAVKGKVRARPSGKFDVRVGQEVRGEQE